MLNIVTCLDVWTQSLLFGFLGLNRGTCLGFKAKHKFLVRVNRGSCLGFERWLGYDAVIIGSRALAFLFQCLHLSVSVLALECFGAALTLS